jgi:hypothetical protein
MQMQALRRKATRDQAMAQRKRKTTATRRYNALVLLYVTFDGQRHYCCLMPLVAAAHLLALQTRST